MKAMNTMMYVSNLIEQLTEYDSKIKNAKDYDEAKRWASRMLGFIDGAHTVTNTMICMENNDFTAEMCDVLAHWEARVYGALGAKAVDTNQDSEIVTKLLNERDEIMRTLR